MNNSKDNALVLKILIALSFVLFIICQIYYLSEYDFYKDVFKFTTFMNILAGISIIVGVFYKRKVLGIGLIVLGLIFLVELFSYDDLESYEMALYIFTIAIPLLLGICFIVDSFAEVATKYFIGLIIISALPLLVMFIHTYHYYHIYYYSLGEYIEATGRMGFYTYVIVRASFVLIAVLVYVSNSGVVNTTSTTLKETNNVITTNLNATSDSRNQTSSVNSITKERTVVHKAQSSNGNAAFCVYCGTALEEGSLFCHNCGKRRAE